MDRMNVVGGAQIALAGVALGFGTWWSVLSLLAIPAPRKGHDAPGMRLVVVVPAHNEEALVAATVRSLAAVRYEPRPELLVVADNCSDRTAEAARAAGATVVERNDPQRRGKSYALEYAIREIGRRPCSPPDAVLVVDADTVVSSTFFSAMAEALSQHNVAQARYDAASSQSDLGRLRRLAFALIHHARPMGAQRLGLPTTLKGNGMGFRWDVVRDGVPGSGVTEDAAATVQLAARGLTVRYVPQARVSGLMAEHYHEARTQDARWEGGRLGLVPAALAVVLQRLRRGDLQGVAAAGEVASPPLSLLALAAVASLVAGGAGIGSLRIGALACASLAGYVSLGLIAARAELRDLRALLHAPRFVGHKLQTLASVSHSRPKSWERTERG